jgi:hypothetical protein
MSIENLIFMFTSSVLDRIIWQNNNISYRNILNTENLVFSSGVKTEWGGVGESK